jgi:dTDP-glucose pyrophosphorylase
MMNYEIIIKNPMFKKYADLKGVAVSDFSLFGRYSFLVRHNAKIGMITRGDIRRVIQRFGIKSNLVDAINWNPNVLVDGLDADRGIELEKIFNSCQDVLAIPVLDENGICTCIAERHNKVDVNDMTVVIMAGGFGKRLGGMTKTTPKPMILLGHKPILEHIISNIVSLGYKNIFLSVYYLKEQIMDYFGSGESFGCSIRYIIEDKPMGTIGCLSLHKDKIDTKYVFLCNGDLYTKIEVQEMHEFIERKRSDFVVATTTYSLQIPYGVINYDYKTSLIEELHEKPEHHYAVSAGMYLFKAKNLNLLSGKAQDAPQYIEDLMSAKKVVHSFSILDKWIDIGLPEHLQNAKKHINGI